MEEKLSEWKNEDMADDDEDNSDSEVLEPPSKLTPTEMLKKKMREEEEQRRGIRITIRNSSIFSNTAVDSSSSFRKECLIYESLPDVFAVPVASSKSERVFSVAGNTVTPQRVRLGTDTTESLVILKTNLGILREMGIRK